MANLRVRGAWPDIFWDTGDSVPVYRCPACSSDRNLGNRTLIDEHNTFAIQPGDIDPKKKEFTYQRYTILECANCFYKYHYRPEGTWFKSNSMYGETLDGIIQKTTIVDEKTKLPIGRWQDHNIIRLSQQKRFSSLELNTGITCSHIALLVGAGFSAPLGFPLSNDFSSRLSPWLLETLDEWLGSTTLTVSELIAERATNTLYDVTHGKRTLFSYASNDVEILMDLLLRIQRIAALYPDKREFLAYMRNLRDHDESIFVFNERMTINGHYYPPITRILVHKNLVRNCNTAHFRDARRMVQEVMTLILLDCWHMRPEMLDTGIRYHMAMFDKLTEVNDCALPLFTTNYDTSIEEIYAAVNRRDKVVTGRESRESPNVSFTRDLPLGLCVTVKSKYPVRMVTPGAFDRCGKGDIALFHLHGSAPWFVDPTSGNVFELDGREGMKEYVLPLIKQSNNPMIPACIFPATVKTDYYLSPPFNVCYDYFSQTISKAKVLIIAGYSGRDNALKNILLWGSQVNPELQFIVVGMDERLPLHLSDVLPDGRTHYLSGGICKQSDTVVSLARSLIK